MEQDKGDKKQEKKKKKREGARQEKREEESREERRMRIKRRRVGEEGEGGASTFPSTTIPFGINWGELVKLISVSSVFVLKFKNLCTFS